MAAGNPFFLEEIVRELAERGVVEGKSGAYISTAEGAEVSVPATLQATIASRIDRLRPEAKRTLNAAAVIGSRFSLGLLQCSGRTGGRGLGGGPVHRSGQVHPSARVCVPPSADPYSGLRIPAQI